MAHKILVAAVSDIGCVRTNNEDSYGYDPARQIYVVCDGMGGMASGEVASQMAVAAVLETFAASDPSLPCESILDQAIRSANAGVFQAGQQPAHKGMGTTLVAACLRDLKLTIGNVGDSRAYLIQGHQPTQVTIDHSYLNELIRSGIVDVKDAATVDLQGMQTVITRAVGVEAAVNPDYFSLDLTPGDVILIATDGLTRYLDAKELGVMIGSCDLQSSAQNMIDVAKERGGVDNITVLLLQVVEESETQTEPVVTEAPLSAEALLFEKTPAAETPMPETLMTETLPTETPAPIPAADDEVVGTS